MASLPCKGSCIVSRMVAVLSGACKQKLRRRDDAAPMCPCTTVSKRRKYLSVFLAAASRWAGGGPIISTMRDSRSCSEAPGKSGSPRNSSAATHPSDHMSMAMVYWCPSTTCGKAAGRTHSSKARLLLLVTARLESAACLTLAGWELVWFMHHTKDHNGARQRRAYLGGAVEAALDVGVHRLVLQARRPKVDDLDVPRLHALEQHVLRLQVAVDDALRVQHRQRVQNLQHNSRRVKLCKDQSACVGLALSCQNSGVCGRQGARGIT